DSAVLSAAAARRRETAGRLRGGFEAACREAAVESAWIEVTASPERLGEVAAYEGRYADLLIAAQPEPERRRDPSLPLADVILGCARPLLIVPYIGAARPPGERILVAWDGSREAARAFGDAMPLLEAA